MKSLDRYKDFKIIIVSDHGSRNTSDPKDEFSVVTLVKNISQQSLIDKKIISVQSVVSKFFGISNNNISTHKYYNFNTKKFEEVIFD